MTSAFGVDHDEVSKGWGSGVAGRAEQAATKVRLKAPKKAKSDARLDYERRAWRKVTNLQERSNAGEKISPMRSRSFAPLESALPEYGGRTGSNWTFNGNKRVRKSMDGEEQGNAVLDTWLATPVPEKTMPRFVRDEKGRFLTDRPMGQARDISHLVEKREKDPTRGNKPFGSPAKTAAVVGVGSAALLGRGRANRVGVNIAQRMQNRSVWSAGRAASMPNGKLRALREGYARKLSSAARKGPGYNQDVREWAGRTAVGTAAGGAAGGAVFARRKLTAKEK